MRRNISFKLNNKRFIFGFESDFVYLPVLRDKQHFTPTDISPALRLEDYFSKSKPNSEIKIKRRRNFVLFSEIKIKTLMDCQQKRIVMASDVIRITSVHNMNRKGFNC